MRVLKLCEIWLQNAVVWACGRGQTHRQTHTRVTNIHLRRLRLTRNVMMMVMMMGVTTSVTKAVVPC